MTISKIPNILLLTQLNLELDQLMRKHKVDLNLSRAKLKNRSTKYKIAHGQYLALYNFRTLVERLKGEI